MKKSNHIDMNKSDHKKLSKNQLIKLLLNQFAKPSNKIQIVEDKIIQPPTQYQDEKPQKGVKQMVKEYEDIIQPPLEFRDDYKQKPKTDEPKTKILQLEKVLNNFTKSFKIEIISQDPMKQLVNTRSHIEYQLKKETNGFKFYETLKVSFMKHKEKDKTEHKVGYFNSKAITIINTNELYSELQTSKQEIVNKIANWISEGSGWTIESVDSHHINTVRYNPLKGSSYIKLPQELRNSAKGLINMKNEDNECFRWCHIRVFRFRGNGKTFSDS